MTKGMDIPKAAKEYGMMRLVFEDDFDSLDTIDIKGLGTKGFKWYTTRPFRAKPLTADDFRVENSVLYLEQHDSLYNYGLCTYNPRTRQGFSFNKGVLEFRFRIPHYDASLAKSSEPDCGGPAIWSFPIEKIHDTALEWVEMDWMEYWGTYDGRFPGGYYTTTFHHGRRDFMNYGGLDFWANNPSRKGPERLEDGEWHELVFLWDDGVVKSWLDGDLAVCQTYGGFAQQPPAKVQKGDAEGIDIFTPMDTQRLPLIISGAKNNPLEIDWIRVWQK